MEQALGIIFLVSLAFTDLYSLDLKIFPQSICYQEHDNLLLSCEFGDNNTIGAKFQFNSRDQLNDSYLINATTVNHNTIEVQIPNLTIPNNVGTYFCSKDGYSSRQIIYIEESVTLPDDIQCYRNDNNFSSLACDWTGSNSTCWDFSIVDAAMGFSQNEQACNVSIQCNSFSPMIHCINAVHGSHTKVRAQCTGSFDGMTQVDFRITGRKFTSTASKIIHKTFSCSSVKLRVTDVTTLNISSGKSEMALIWRTSGSPEGNCDCVKQCMISTNQNVPDVVTQSCSNDTFYYTLHLTNLKPLTACTSTITCTVIGSEVWSIEEPITYTIPLEGGILAGPNQEGYRMYSCHEQFYCLMLYWKNLTDIVKRIKILVSNQDTSLDYEVSYSPFTFIRLNKTENCQHFNVDVYGESSSGIATHVTSFQAMDYTCSLVNSFSCSIVNATYLQLTRLNHSEDLLITIYWCFGTRKNDHIECETFIQWSRQLLHTSELLVPIAHPSWRSNGTWYIGANLGNTDRFACVDWNACKDPKDLDALIRERRITGVIVSLVICIVFIVVIVFTVLVCLRKKIQIIEKYFKKNSIRTNTARNVQNEENTEAIQIPLETNYQTMNSNDFYDPVHQPGISLSSQKSGTLSTVETEDSEYISVEKASFSPVYMSEQQTKRQNVDNGSTCRGSLSVMSDGSANSFRTNSVSSYCKTNVERQLSDLSDDYKTEGAPCVPAIISSEGVHNNLGYVTNNSDWNFNSDSVISSSTLQAFPLIHNLSDHKKSFSSDVSSYTFVGNLRNKSLAESSGSSSDYKSKDINHIPKACDHLNETNTSEMCKQFERAISNCNTEEEIKLNVQNNLDYIPSSGDCFSIHGTDSRGLLVMHEPYCFSDQCLKFPNHSDMEISVSLSLTDKNTCSKSILRTSSISSYCKANEVQEISDKGEHFEAEALDSKLETITVDVHNNVDYVSNTSPLPLEDDICDNVCTSFKLSKATSDLKKDETDRSKPPFDKPIEIRDGCEKADNSSNCLTCAALKCENNSHNVEVLKSTDGNKKNNLSFDPKCNGNVNNDQLPQSQSCEECCHDYVKADEPLRTFHKINEFGYLQG